MNLTRCVLFFTAILLFATCETYDNALIYHKNFQPGVHSLLRFDGYYSDTLAGGGNSLLKNDKIRPIFFYSDGSAFSATNYFVSPPAIGKEIVNTINGAWGNYLIEADTITLERFQKVENNYRRIIMKGIISKDQIHWTSRKEHREKYKAIDYSVFFVPNNAKPDSTKNFTRTLEIYNRK